MASASLTATPRSDVGKGAARSLRRSGQIPGVIYGHARQAQPIAVAERDLEKLLEKVAHETTVIELALDGATARTLIREIQRHPFKRQILSIDFQELVAGETVTVRVPVLLVGTPEGVRNGGILDQTMREIEIEADPSNLPNHIELDVSGLQLGHSVHVADLTVPAGVTVLEDEEATICVCVAPRTTEAEAAPAEEAATSAEPELIRKAKPEEGEEEK